MKIQIALIPTTLLLCIIIVHPAPGSDGSGRTPASVMIVANTADTGPGSLRQAMIDANGNPGPDTVAFAIPRTDAGFDSVAGVWTIQPASFLPALTTEATVIDGRTQAAFVGEDTNPLGPEIEIDGSNAGTNAFGIALFGDGIRIQHLTINRFDGAGIFVYGANWGHIAGCYLGTDPTGRTGAPNYYGVSIDGGSISIHVVPLDTIPNVICGNTIAGVSINDTSKHNIILGNLIGVTSDRSDTLGNGWGSVSILNNSDSNEVVDCWIGGSVSGIGIGRAHGNTIMNNFIGTSPDRQTELPNTSRGILITQGSQHNRVIENVISHNGGFGIEVSDSATMFNTLSRNGISHNELQGLYLDRKANAEIAAPVILSAMENQITGTASPGDTVECFADTEDEGEIYIGAAAVDGSGNFTLATAQPVPPLGYVTATATDAAGNTSAFSTAFVYAPTSVASGGRLPQAFSLSQNYPNPFNPTTVIKFSLPSASHARLEVLNQLGQLVAVLADGRMAAGQYQAEFSGAGLSSGVYFSRVTAQSESGRLFSATRKMLLLR